MGRFLGRRYASALTGVIVLAVSSVSIATAGASAGVPRPPVGKVTASLSPAGTLTAGHRGRLELRVGYAGSARPSGYSLDFGDHSPALTGERSPAGHVAHTYDRPGWYTVRLRVSAAHARTVATRTRVLVVTPPSAPIPVVMAPASPGGPEPTSSVTSFAPGSGPVDTTVTITGSGFTSPATVTIGGATATVSSVTSTSIRVVVPVNAKTGALVVTSNGTTTTVGTFTVSLGLIQTLTYGPPTSSYTLYGSGFKPGEPVDLFVGSAANGFTAANAQGNIAVSGFTIPASAQPGVTQVSAVNRTGTTATQAAFTISTDWAQFGSGPEHNGYNRFENTVGTTNVADLSQKWSSLTPTAISSAPAVYQGVVYVVGINGTLRALSAATGAQLWSYAGTGTSYSSPAVAGGVVYFGAGSSVYAVNVGTGTLKWTRSLGTGGSAWDTTPTVVGSTVYVNNGPSVFALNVTSGATVWSFATGAFVYGAPTVWNGVVFFGSYDGSLYARNATTGAEVWRASLSDQFFASPVVANGRVYVAGTTTHKIYGLNADTGVTVWSATMPDQPFATPALARGVLYAWSYDGTATAYDSSTGSVIWSRIPLAGNAPNGGDLTVANGVLYAGGYLKSTFMAVSTVSGALLWSAASAGVEDTAAVLVNGTLYTAAGDARVTAYTLGGR